MSNNTSLEILDGFEEATTAVRIGGGIAFLFLDVLAVLVNVLLMIALIRVSILGDCPHNFVPIGPRAVQQVLLLPALLADAHLRFPLTHRPNPACHH